MDRETIGSPVQCVCPLINRSVSVFLASESGEHSVEEPDTELTLDKELWAIAACAWIALSTSSPKTLSLF